MSNSGRAGFLIVAAVFVYSVVVWLFIWISALVAAVNAQLDLEWANRMLSMATMLAFFLLWGRALWMGQGMARWLGVLCLVSIGVFWILLAVLFATWEVRLEIQGPFRRELPWRIGLGVLNIIVGASLLLPPVGQFLRKRRTVGAEPGAAADRARD